MKLPVVAIVGRPNVGKSTLFNRLTHTRQAITSPVSGVTRDRHVAEAEFDERRFLVMDTGGWVPGSQDIFETAIREQVQFALEECDLVLFIVDAYTGPTDVDMDIAKMLLRSPLPVILVVNKSDGPKQEPDVPLFYSLGLGDPQAVGAEGGSNVAELMNHIVEHLPEIGKGDELARPRPLVAIVGRPNVGKSSFVNAIAGKPIRVVTDIAGTTRDSADTIITYYQQRMTLIDTAGLRRKSRINESLEFYTNVRTERALYECDVAVILTDANDGFVAQDIRIVQEALELGKGIVLCINKWDLIEKDSKTADNWLNAFARRYATLDYIPKIFMSCFEMQRVHKVLEEILRVHEERQKRIDTSELNRLLKEMMESNPPPTVKGRDMRIIYMTQPVTEPPLFVFWMRHPELLADHYRRYIEGRLRHLYGFQGVPIKLAFRERT
jgi:GTPase